METLDIHFISVLIFADLENILQSKDFVMQLLWPNFFQLNAHILIKLLENKESSDTKYNLY